MQLNAESQGDPKITKDISVNQTGSIQSELEAAIEKYVQRNKNQKEAILQKEPNTNHISEESRCQISSDNESKCIKTQHDKSRDQIEDLSPSSYQKKRRNSLNSHLIAILDNCTMSLPQKSAFKRRKSSLDTNLLMHIKAFKAQNTKDSEQIEVYLSDLTYSSKSPNQQAIPILQKPIQERLYSDLAHLVKCTENVGFFKKYDEDTNIRCMAKMYHVHLKKGERCINFGEYGETFWVTLKGKVAVMVPMLTEFIDNNGELKKQKILTKVAEQGPGYAFGELALLERKLRAATIVCEEDSDFALLDKEEKEESRLFAEVNFLKSLKIFSHWAYNSVRSLFMYSQLKTYVRNQIVYSQFDPPEYMHIIKEGEFKIMFRAQYEDDNPLASEGGVVDKYLKKKYNSREIELSILGPGEIFGVEELRDNRNRAYTVICVSQTAVVYQINKKEAITLVLNEVSAKAWLKDYLNSRAQIQSKRIANIHKNTRKFKTFLMYPNLESPKKLNDDTTTTKDKTQSENKKSFDLKPLKDKSPESSRNHNSNKDFDAIYRKRTFSAEKVIMQYEERCLKEIPVQKWYQDKWLNKKGSLTPSNKKNDSQESLDVQDSSENKYIYYSSDKAKKDEGKIVKLSLTTRLFSEYKEKMRLHRGDRDKRFSKNPSKPQQRPDTARSPSDNKVSRRIYSTGASPTNKITIFSENQRTPHERKDMYTSSSPSPTSFKLDESPKFSARNFTDNAGKYQLKVHKAFSSLDFLKSSHYSKPQLESNCNKGNMSQRIILPIDPANQLSQLELLWQRRSNLKQNNVPFYMEGDPEKPKSNQMFYNSTISRTTTANASSPNYKSTTQIGLQVREQLLKIDKSLENKPKKLKLAEIPSENVKNDNIITTAIQKQENVNNQPSAELPKAERASTLLNIPFVQNEISEKLVFIPKFKKGSPISNKISRSVLNFRDISQIKAGSIK